MQDKTDHLKNLGSNKTTYEYNEPHIDTLETFPNRYPNNVFTVKFQTEEFTSLCPKTGQPDFGEIIIEYIPHSNCIETKSLKLYLHAFRNSKSFMESIVNKILNDCLVACAPKYMLVTGNFKRRGGIAINVEVAYWGPERECQKMTPVKP